MVQHINIVLLIFTNLFLIIFFISALFEKEKRAALFSIIIIIANSSLWLLLIMFNHLNPVTIANYTVFVLFVTFIFISLPKFFPEKQNRDLSKIQKFDERNHMFSRNNLKFHPDIASKYYSANPEKKELDQKIQKKPKIGEPCNTYYEYYNSPVFEASHKYLFRTMNAARGDTNKEKKKIDTEVMTETIKKISHFFGAIDVGITKLKPYHIYSHSGRWRNIFGKSIETSHKFAIVIIVAMNIKMIKSAPSLPIILESFHQYVESAKIANILAEYIRSFGYDARAHTDGNYEVLCVPLAVDAGLGELGRLGIFVHPIYGPCVRLSVVTTELELVRSTKKTFFIDQFCKICKKCADNCPTQSISSENQNISRGFKHWSIDQENCYSFWRNIGTDCGFCISVCPYTKPNTLIHKLVRFYISRNSINQRIALFFDDFFYGRKIKIPSKNPKNIFR